MDHLCQFVAKLVHSFSKYRVHKIGNGRTDERADGPVRNTRPMSSASRRHKNDPAELSPMEAKTSRAHWMSMVTREMASGR